ncbi:hypothetical protein P154DRAFT_529232 [Amniculicola lignicola CBS 123094]|uniref:Uncharacterized protein n=1 Tax=Amniculicola lignicola CBS 123094 TaxID=1392246 RepID=A0A6A5X0E9_9PLEO|nr:hypothetical protein P154DRAFT_529232 [Amniculicola lignicola CBS 123094]
MEARFRVHEYTVRNARFKSYALRLQEEDTKKMELIFINDHFKVMTEDMSHSKMPGRFCGYVQAANLGRFTKIAETTPVDERKEYDGSVRSRSWRTKVIETALADECLFQESAESAGQGYFEPSIDNPRDPQIENTTQQTGMKRPWANICATM